MPRIAVSKQEIDWLVPKVEDVLKKATKRARGRNIFLSAYQVLEELAPKTVRGRILAKFGQGGKGSGNIPAATKVVMMALVKVPDVEIMYMSPDAVKFFVTNAGKKEEVPPADDKYFAIYRLPAGSPRSRRCKLSYGVASATLVRSQTRRNAAQ